MRASHGDCRARFGEDGKARPGGASRTLQISANPRSPSPRWHGDLADSGSGSGATINTHNKAKRYTHQLELGRVAIVNCGLRLVTRLQRHRQLSETSFLGGLVVGFSDRRTVHGRLTAGNACMGEFHESEADFIPDVRGTNGFGVGARPGFLAANRRRRELVERGRSRKALPAGFSRDIVGPPILPKKRISFNHRYFLTENRKNA